MTLLAIVLVLSLGVFVVAFFSPHKGEQAQRHSERALNLFLRKIRNCPSWVRALVSKPPILSHKTFSKSADFGKTARKKSKSMKP